MTTATTDPATSDPASLDADRYLQEVAPHLATLPAAERADLLDDLAQHLREIAAEPGPPLAERLGSPQAYAAELLASAGVAASIGPSPLLSRAASLSRRARGSALGRELERLWPVLQPAWWVARGYLAVSLVAALDHRGPAPEYLLPRLVGSPAVGLLAVLLAVSVSVRLGQRPLSQAGRMVTTCANVVLVLFALSLVGRGGPVDARQLAAYSGPVAPGSRGCLLDGSGQPITNLYGYDADGHLVDPVLLYDQDGQPVTNVCGNPKRGRPLSTEHRLDVNGAPVLNAFPQRQSVLGGLPAVVKPGVPARPQAGLGPALQPPAVVVPRLAPTPTAPTARPGG